MTCSFVLFERQLDYNILDFRVMQFLQNSDSEILQDG